MPISSQFPPLDLSETDIWSFLFERKSKPFPDDKGISPNFPSKDLTDTLVQSSIRMGTQIVPSHTPKSVQRPLSLVKV
jgi:hypothetical protein